jgi:hypothetical protein
VEALVQVILPIFLVIGFGYLAAWRRLMSPAGVDGLMKFAQGFAIPVLLFRAISTLDLSHELDPRLLLSFYGGATVGFAAGLLGARYLFGRAWEDSVAIGFCGLFSNTLMLGLSITERAYGADALAGNYTIIAIHSPFGYALGITAMELVRNRGGHPLDAARRVLTAVFRNPLVIGITLGFIANLGHIPVPGAVADAIDLMTRAAIPAALFGLGGVLYRYRPEGDMRIIAMICLISLVLHPTVTWGLGRAMHLPPAAFRSAVVTAAMAPGINAYLFADMYGVAKRVAASSVLFATAATILTAWAWLALLG